MAGFKHSVAKYGENGIKVPSKKEGGITKFRKLYPNIQVFDSKSEYDTYILLKQLQKQKKISNLKLQVPFLLIPGTKWYNNVKEKWEIVRKTEYICDFVFERDGQKVALDAKGWALRKDRKTGKTSWKAYTDDVYKIKKKLFLQLYPEYIFEEA
jgi:hypothetical protein